MKVFSKSKDKGAAALKARGRHDPLDWTPQKLSARLAGHIRRGVRVRTPRRLQPVAERFPALEEQEVVLTFFAPLARWVKVAGNFNGWNPEATSMRSKGTGEWVARLKLRSGQYEYRFLTDGQWSDDPDTSHRQANPYGGFNSVVTVPLPTDASIL